jgi:HK97 family phage prohead protease
VTTAERKSPPREDICRSVDFTPTRDASDDGLTFEGYGAVFDSPTRIDSWEGTFDEVLARGAFRKSIRENIPKFQFDHGRSVFGSLPCGVISDIREDDNGLFVTARMGASWFWEPLREAVGSGAVDGMSFRFSVVREEWRDAEGKIVKPEDLNEALWSGSRGVLMRTLKEVKVAEVGPVVWPAYTDTTASLRSRSIDLDALRNGDSEQRKLFAAAALTIRVAENTASERGESDEEPQDTTHDVAVEHSDVDADTPQSTEVVAGEHVTPSEIPAPVDDVDVARAAETDRQFAAALAEVKNTRESTPPMKGA